MADADKKGAQQVFKNVFKPLTSATMGAVEYVVRIEDASALYQRS